MSTLVKHHGVGLEAGGHARYLLYVVLRHRPPSISRRYRAVELAPPEIQLRMATRHRGYWHAVFTFLADAVLIRGFFAELAHAETAPL
jgi:hypothetical protein